MINVVNEFGWGFRGLISYLLRGPNNDNPERVDWSLCVNLGTDDVELGTKIMIDTARRADDLKRAAGHGSGGRSSKGPVMHYVLSWAPWETETLTKEEMQRAALESLKVLGKKRSKRRSVKTQTGDEHQAIIVAHRDRGHYHVHVALCRTHPEHGLSLPSYKSHVRLSDWAHEYRKEMGLEHLTPERVKNYEARKRSRRRPVQGVRVRGKPRVPRHIYELQQCASNDNRLHHRRREMHKRRDRQLTVLERRTVKKQQEARRAVDQAYLDQTEAIRRQTQTSIGEANQRINRVYDQKWERLLETHRKEIEKHEEHERSWIGRQKNRLEAFSSIDFRELIRGDRRKRVLSDMFKVFTRPGAGVELLKRRLYREALSLRREKEIEERLARGACKDDEAKRLSEHRRTYLRDRADLLSKQRRERERIKRLWAKQREARIAQFEPWPDADPATHAQAVNTERTSMPEVFRRSASPNQLTQNTDDDREREIDETLKRLEQSRKERERRPRKPRRKR